MVVKTGTSWEHVERQNIDKDNPAMKQLQLAPEIYKLDFHLVNNEFRCKSPQVIQQAFPYY